MKITELKVMVEITPNEILSYFYEQLAKEHKLQITDVNYDHTNGKVVMYGLKTTSPTAFPISKSPIKVVERTSHSPNGQIPSTAISSTKSYKGLSKFIDVELPPGHQIPIELFARNFLQRQPKSGLTITEIKNTVLSTYKHKGIIEKDAGVLYRKES